MPRKTKEVKLSASEIQRIITQQDSIRLAIMTLLAGKPWATTRFPGYYGHITKLKLAHDQQRADNFVNQLSAYFADAAKLIPYVPNTARGQKACLEIANLVSKYGVRQVASTILARMIR
jgi:hypothetical protein